MTGFAPLASISLASPPGSDGRVTVTLAALPDDGNSAITNVQYDVDGGTPVSLPSYAGLDDYQITGLNTLGPRAFRVRAVNAVGNGAWSVTKNVITDNGFMVPVITGVPTIAGTEQVGETLTATAASVVGHPTPTRTWQWVNSVSGNISGATNSTYVLQASDEGDTITVVQTETNGMGVDTATSAATGAIAAAPAAPTLDTVTFTDNNDGTPASLALTYTGDVTGYRVYIATGDATISVSAAQLYAGTGGTGTLEFTDFAVGASIDITGLTATSNSAVRISAALIKSADGSDPSNVVTETVSGLDFTAPAAPTAATDVAGDTITLTFAETIYGAQDIADWVLSGAGANSRTITQVTGFGTSTITLELSGAVLASPAALTLAYTNTDSDLRDADANNLANFSGLTVTNNLAASGITSPTGASEVIAADAGQAQVNAALPTSLENDIVIIAVSHDNGVSDNSASSGVNVDVDLTGQGWTVVHNPGGVTPGCIVGLKRMGVTPDTTIPVFPSTTKATAFVARAYRGVHTTTAQDATATTASGASGTPDCPSITTVTNNAMVVAVGMGDDDDYTLTAPSGYSNLTSIATGGLETSSTNDASAAIASKLIATAGAEDPGAFGSAMSDDWHAVTIALRPA